MQDINEIPRLLRWKQVQELIPFSRSYIYNLISQDRFPSPVKLIEGGRGAGWWEHEIRAYVESRHQDTRGSGHNEEV
jgi:predicted DNA-binding transcriptional regulator AlpA